MRSRLPRSFFQDLFAATRTGHRVTRVKPESRAYSPDLRLVIHDEDSISIT
jgi:hypothetical protein